MSQENKNILSVDQIRQDSFLVAGQEYLDYWYELYLKDPQQVPASYRQHFDQLPRVNGSAEFSHQEIRDYFQQRAKQPKYFSGTAVESATTTNTIAAHILQLIDGYRRFGHFIAELDPLGKAKKFSVSELHPNFYQLSDNDLNQTLQLNESFVRGESLTGHAILDRVKTIYCKTVASEYMHITKLEERQWLQQKIETQLLHKKLPTEQKRRILQTLLRAENLEKYLGAKYVGQKRFSLEGADSLMPLMDTIVQQAPQQGVEQIFIGMAHRGRLNVLVNILGKSPLALFQAFEGQLVDEQISGDVKYHMGYASDVVTQQGTVHVALAFNPSHLEIINPVVEGSTFARQVQINDDNKQKAIPILIHGDAAFAGQGVVMETMNFAQVRGYATGGTLHIVVNNQVGFTTDSDYARSTYYCTDIAKMLDIPVFHVNADDPEAVVLAAQIAFEYRMRYRKDVLIDLICYRRHGHNEADDPSITQPTMYSVIKKHPTAYEIYEKQLVVENVIQATDAKQWIADYRATLDAGTVVVPLDQNGAKRRFMSDWKPFLNQSWRVAAKTGVALDKIKKLATIIETLPKDFNIHPQVDKLMAERRKMTAGELAINWGYAETLAYATLLDEGYLVRISGQDVGRGTFAHRHALLHDSQTGGLFAPLAQLAKQPNHFMVLDSTLSEEGVLGFEYGFASTEPKGLIVWEAQFGDFANGAQVVIDQFISSGEQKWGRLCSLVMLLPHGYEGQGPEHTSARLERYLQLCAQENIQVCMPTTPAQIFHLLRRQLIRAFRKPLIVMTPKSLLRHKLAVSDLSELADKQFLPVISEVDAIKNNQVQRVILCSGKVYYDLLARRRELKRDNIALIRVEQLYPFPDEELKQVLGQYKQAKQIIWCQEEPQNQGAWYAIRTELEACLAKGQTLHYVGRPSSASPAAGSTRVHAQEQTALIEAALE